jgi:hypothetical protein
MAVKKTQNSKPKTESMTPSKKCDNCGCSCSGKWVTMGWGLLLLGGLAHMLPIQMAPVLKWALWGITLQMVVGVLSVVTALYFLLGNE